MTTTTTTSAYSAPAQRSLPIGVAILAVLIGIYGFFIFLVGLLIAVGSALFGAFVSANPLSHFGLTGLIGGLIILIIGLVILALAIGLWDTRMWALVLTLLFLGFEMVIYGLAGAFLTLGFVIALILFIYLLAVSRHFS